MKRVSTGRGNKQSLTTNPEEGKFLDAWFPTLSTVVCFFELFYLLHSLRFHLGSTLQQSFAVIRKPLAATNVIDFLCEKLVVTYQIPSFLFSAHFVDIVSKALGIPKWRLFNIRTEEGDKEGCLIVKFGIIGTGNSAGLTPPIALWLTPSVIIYGISNWQACDKLHF